MQIASKRIHSGRVIDLDVDSVRFPDGSIGQLEIPAGRLNPGEDPQVCAHRELLEEVGVKAGRVERLTTIWTTPGFTDERIHLFWAADLTADKHAREPDEFIEVMPKPLSETLNLIRDGVICDAKTVVGILYMAGFTLRY